jgi:hypothetical protein
MMTNSKQFNAKLTLIYHVRLMFGVQIQLSYLLFSDEKISI